MSRLRILLVTRSASVAAEVDELLHDNPQFKLQTKLVSNGHVDPMQDVVAMPDILLVHCESAHGELRFLAESRGPGHPPLIVIGPRDDPEAMRLAMRAGSGDYLTSPLRSDELSDALARVSEQLVNSAKQSGEIVTVVNSLGGSGASFIAANLAYALHGAESGRVLLVDFDLQFGGLCRYFDMNPKQGIIEALDAVEDLDEVSGETYITRHKSGLRLLAACSDSLCLANDVSVSRVDMLFRMLSQHNENIIVDLPRRIDLLGATILENSDRILLVVQQSLSHLHDAIRMMRLITQELRLPADRVTVVLNRFDKKSVIEASDVCDALKVEQLIAVPNDYDLVTESIDAGKPLVERSKNSTAARAIAEVANHVRGIDDAPTSGNFLQRAIPALLGRGH